jgi:thymidylate kinase
MSESKNMFTQIYSNANFRIKEKLELWQCSSKSKHYHFIIQEKRKELTTIESKRNSKRVFDNITKKLFKIRSQ